MRPTRSDSFRLYIACYWSVYPCTALFCFEKVEWHMTFFNIAQGTKEAGGASQLSPQSHSGWLDTMDENHICHWLLCLTSQINKKSCQDTPRQHITTPGEGTRLSHRRDASFCPIKSHHTCCGTCYVCTGHFGLYRDACINGLGLWRHRGQIIVQQE